MKRVATLLALLALGASSLAAQAKPNFSGHWVVIPDSTKPANGMGGMATTEAVIAQDEKTLAVTRATAMGEVKVVYNLDGSDSKNTIQMGPNSADLLSHAKWEGNKLTINTTINMGGQTVNTSSTYSLDSNGNLVVEQTSPGMGGGAITLRTVFKKT
jgi:hypothetical protein